MSSPGNPEGVRERVRSARGRPYQNVRDPRSVSLLGVGMVIGAVLGAGIAVLVAPRTGPETRRQISRRLGSLRSRRGVWGKLGRELKRAAAAKRKEMMIDSKRREIAIRSASGGVT